MGQTLSAPLKDRHAGAAGGGGALKDRWPDPTRTLPAPLPLHNTTVLEYGSLSDGGVCFWYVESGVRRFPLPVGYRAACKVYGNQTAQLSVERAPGSHAPQFIVRPETEPENPYYGFTPTAPFAKWGLAQRRLDIVNGLDAFGFSNPGIQAALREMAQSSGLLDTPVIQATSGAPVGAWAQRIKAHAQQYPDSGPSLVDRIRRGMATAAQEESLRAQRAPSTTPSLHTWLDLTPAMGSGGASPRSPETQEVPPGMLTTDAAMRKRRPPTHMPLAGTTATPFGDASALYTSAYGGGGGAPVPPGSALPPRGLPPRPLMRQGSLPGTGQPLPTPEAHAANLVTRPSSRQRRRPPSAQGGTGRGWTAFTAYGLEMRDVVRAEAPWASATDIEKIVGQRWAMLSPEDKSHYATVAAEVRRSSQGAPPGADSLGAPPGDEEAAKRTRSDAATALLAVTEERQLRPHRRPRYYGPEFDTTDAGTGTGTGADMGGAGVEGAQKRIKMETARRGKKEGGISTAEDEADVLGLLADMRAEVIASDSAQSEGGHGVASAGVAGVAGGGGGAGELEGEGERVVEGGGEAAAEVGGVAPAVTPVLAEEVTLERLPSSGSHRGGGDGGGGGEGGEGDGGGGDEVHSNSPPIA